MDEIRDEFFDFIDLNNFETSEDPFINTFSFEPVQVKEENSDFNINSFLVDDNIQDTNMMDTTNENKKTQENTNLNIVQQNTNNFKNDDVYSFYSSLTQNSNKIQPNLGFWNTQFNQIQFSQNYLRILEGFNNQNIKKQPGGKDNIKDVIDKQIIELNDKSLKNIQINTLTCQASVVGYDKMKREKVILSLLSEKTFQQTNDKRWICIFDNLIVKFSSHLNGQKLLIRFTLFDSKKNILCFLDSYEFETITKRGRDSKNSFFNPKSKLKGKEKRQTL
jgi:hypothetical protein